MDKISTKSALEKLATEMVWQLNTKQDTLTFDSALSQTSKNPIKNNAVYNQYMTSEEVSDMLLSIDPDYYSKQYLTIRINYSNNEISSTALFNTTGGTNLKVSVNGGEWVTYQKNTTSITIKSGTTIRLKAVGNIYNNTTNGFLNPTIFGDTTLDCSIYGNILSLVFGDNFKGKTSLTGVGFPLTFGRLFAGIQGKVDVTKLILPLLDLSGTTGIYQYLFYNSNIEYSPELPATTLGDSCYQYMFSNCSNLKEFPKLNATTLATKCYQYMFFACRTAKNVPDLPATTLQTYCYAHMFSGCKAITETMELKATTAVEACYRNMFDNCDSLTTVMPIALTTLAKHCCIQMFDNTPSLVNGPTLLATASAEGCYQSMFAHSAITSLGCMLAENTATNCIQEMIGQYTARNGVIYKNSSASFWSSTYAVMYYGWTTQNAILYTITATSSPSAGGTIKGAGTYRDGQDVTLTAIPNSAYSFINWRRGASVISVTNPWTFAATQDLAAVANFQQL